MEWEEILTIVNSIGILGLIGLLFFKSFFGRLGSNYADLVTKKDLTDIERKVNDRYDRELRLFEEVIDKNKISYTKIYDRQFEILVELFQKLQNLYGIMAIWTARIKPVIESEELYAIQTQLVQNVFNTIADFRNFTLLNRIFFDKEFNEFLAVINDDVWIKYADYGYKIDLVKNNNMDNDLKREFYRDLYKISKDIQDKFPKYIDETENRIRNILKIVDEAVKKS